MSNYVSNTPISQPISLNNVTADVDLNGVMFSFQIGLIYAPQQDFSPLTAPAQYGQSGQISTGQ
jgi:hypothetical protein